ncbi:MAG: MBL fold metallo-hydrolase [Gemmatimonadales bacterium]|nr:MBL fold metallo-hydrolase [Gemmatimonadales bacterium]
MNARLSTVFTFVTGLALAVPLSAAQQPTRITVLVDAFGAPSALRQDWGFSALVEYRGKRILFDTGNDADILAHNAKTLGVDLARLDFVVVSHRHGDHTDGLRHVLKLNPSVRVYVPKDEYFGGPTPAKFYRRGVAALPAHMRYFGGKPPAQVPHGTPWRHANFVLVDSVTEVVPGVRLIPALGHAPGTADIPELSLTLHTPTGQVLLVGCSHPGIEEILRAASAPKSPVRLLAGGLHLLAMSETDIERLAGTLRDKWKVAEIAPGHCSGEPAFSTLQKAFGRRYRFAGLGTAIEL